MVLLLAGVAGLGAWVGVNVVSTLWQYWANWTFDAEAGRDEIHNDEIHERTPSAPAPSDGSLIGRLTIPRLNLSAMVRDRKSVV